MRIFYLLFSLLVVFHLQGQEQKPYQITHFDPDEILIQGEEVPKVLLVGSFHFAYYGLDAHVVAEEDAVNVLSPERQKEMKELVDYIAQFKPTKIVVEGGRNSGYILRRYERYLEDSTKLKANEIDQIAFRLMKKFHLDTLYGVDAGTLVNDLYNHKDSITLQPILDSIYTDWDFRNNDPISQRYKALYSNDDKLALNNTLLEFFTYLNSDKRIARGWGAYLTGDFKNGTYEGADALAMHWYARNLRIFRNIQNVIEKPQDRVLVLFGAGHMTILKNLFESSPEFELVKFGLL